MAVFIEARTDPFVERREATARDIRAHGRGQFAGRRPSRGYQLKEDTFAVIRVMGPDGQFMSVIDAAGEEYSTETNTGVTTQYSNFFIQSISEQRQEKQQIVETFGDSWIFFFGEAPRLLQVSGYLLNTADFNWRAEFWENYDRYFRGTRLVELGARLYLMYDDIIVEGYMIGASAQEGADPMPAVLQFSFQMFVTGYTNVSRLGDPDFPAPTDMDYAQLSSYDQAIQNWQQGRNLQRELSSQAVIEANRKGYQQGVGKLMADTLQANLIDAGDPSISAFIARAYLATRAIANAAQMSRQEASGNGLRPNPFAPEGERETALRQQFTHNIDEYIGTPDDRTSTDLANPLSMAERWLEMDRTVDNGLDNMLSGGADSGGTEFWDVMGRAGRAQQEIVGSGGTRLMSQNINRGMLIGSASQSGNQAAMARSVPFGMSILSGEML